MRRFAPQPWIIVSLVKPPCPRLFIPSLLTSSVLLLVTILLSPEVHAQTQQRGALDFDGVIYVTDDSPTQTGGILRATAMAVDRMPDTVVGRFGELRVGTGLDFEADLLPYEFHFKLGVGLATDYFVLFAATGIAMDGYAALRDEVKDREVVFAVGFPLALGLWLKPFEQLDIYALAEPTWYVGAPQREVPKIQPVDFGQEMRSRLGLGMIFDQLHIRLEYTNHQVAPATIHLFSLGFGYVPSFMNTDR